MNMKRSITVIVGILVGIVIAVGLAAAPSRAQRASQQSRAWEYRVVTTTDATPQEQLDRLGAAGWELVSVVTREEAVGTTTQRRQVLYLKRE